MVIIYNLAESGPAPSMLECDKVKIKCFRIECEVCRTIGSCQVFYNAQGVPKYSRVRHYEKVVEGKPKFIYHPQTLAYVLGQIEKQNQQNLSSSKDFNTVASGSEQASGNDDQLGQNTANIIDPKGKESSSNLETRGRSSSLVRTLALRAKGRRFKSGSAHLLKKHAVLVLRLMVKLKN